MSLARKYRHLSDPPVKDAPYNIDVDPDRCVGCGLCVRQCPCQTLELRERDFSRHQQPTCQTGCPAGVDIRAYMKALSEGGSFEEAFHIIAESNPFPAVTGRICPHPCESGCNRRGLDEPLNIHMMERFIGDQAIQNDLVFKQARERKPEKVAVVGGGPSGLSCAYQLARRGYPVTVFESGHEPGGMLSHAIPDHRLPAGVVDKEIQRIVDLGVEIRCNTTVGKDTDFEELRQRFDAVYVSVGAQDATALQIEGEEAGNVHTGLDYLRRMRQGEAIELGGKVAVIGGGNTAVDAARVARRMGAEVTIFYRRTEQEMPAIPHEVAEAVKEGVKIRYLCSPARIERGADGCVSALTCVMNELGDEDASGRRRPVPIEGSEFTVDLDAVISAVGQRSDTTGLDALFAAENRIRVDLNGATAEEGVFAGGDAVLGPATVCEAIGAGRRAALAIEASFHGEEFSPDAKEPISYENVPLDDYPEAERNRAPELSVESRLSSPDAEVNQPFEREQALDECKRCLLCGRYQPAFTRVSSYFGEICLACHNCAAICPHDALDFPRYYQVEEGRWTTDHLYPDPGKGFPNPFGQEETPPFSEIAPKLTDVEKVIYTRRSNRVFTDRQVPRDVVHRILEAGRFAPSAGNGMPWQFLVIRDRQLLDGVARDCRRFLARITKLYQGRDPFRKPIKDGMALFMPGSIDQRPMVAIQAMLTPKFREGELDMFHGARTVIFVLSNRLGISNPPLDAGICCQNMVLAAHALGIGTCYVSFAVEPTKHMRSLRKKLKLEWPYDVLATTIALGYPAREIDRPVDREIPRVRWIEPQE